MQALIHAAGIQDRDGGVLLMGSLFGLYPFLPKLYADSGYQGANFQAGLRAVCGQVNLEGSYRDPGCWPAYLTRAATRAPRRALPRRRALCTNSKKPR